MSTFFLERANLSARIGVKPLTGRIDVCVGKCKPVSAEWDTAVDGVVSTFVLERANLSARIGVKPLTGRVDVFLGESKPVSQDRGKAVDGSCRRFSWREQTCQPGLG